MPPTEPPTGPAPEEPQGPDTREAIARDLDRLRREVEKLRVAREHDEEVKGLWKACTRLAERQDMLAAGAAETPAGSAWMLQVGTEPDKAVELLKGLADWLAKVFLQFPNAQLPTCWARHPWLVQELLWLRDYFMDAYGPRGSATAQGMWHDQSLPNLLGRMQKAGVNNCDLDEHKPGGQQAKDPIAVPGLAYLEAVATDWALTGLTTEPTEDELEDARQYRAAKRKRSVSPSSSSAAS